MSEFWSGLIGVIVGALVTVASQWAIHLIKTAKVRRVDNKRKALLTELLNNPGKTGWRTMATLSGVIGSTRDDTARLLIEIGARSNEKDGADVWAWTKDKPLPKPD